MNANSKGVLAVMDAAIRVIERGGTVSQACGLREARAAAAELLEFAESVKSMTAHHGRIESVRTKWFNEKATAAIARATGELA